MSGPRSGLGWALWTLLGLRAWQDILARPLVTGAVPRGPVPCRTLIPATISMPSTPCAADI